MTTHQEGRITLSRDEAEKIESALDESVCTSDYSLARERAREALALLTSRLKEAGNAE